MTAIVAKENYKLLAAQRTSKWLVMKLREEWLLTYTIITKSNLQIKNINTLLFIWYEIMYKLKKSKDLSKTESDLKNLFNQHVAK